ncbi:hypothetical protein [Cedecea sp. NFIX57]|uniref:hypothetical protein n=1 Tax=Cedecea sp. NFIX57 TaxID=1566286 RepID=UPI000A0AE169|nr:hypothetical protein [Cedecea sp. NFIX57]SMG60180.1 hypothetical protein SAMN03159353_103426 [Cedecea sp. NFIX57]
MVTFPAWWKHGTKVKTKDGRTVTLNIAPDNEYWFTDDSGKEVFVFSLDIDGPVEEAL